MFQAPSIQDIEYQLLHFREDRRREIISINIPLIVVASISVVLRLLGRRIHRAPWKADDYVMMLAMLIAFGLCATEILTVHYGLGRHALVVGIYNTHKYLKWLYAYEICYIVSIATVKLSILLFYRRIFPTRNVRIAIFAVLAFTFIWTVCSLSIVIFQCHPIYYFWRRTGPGNCLHEVKAIIGISIPNIVTDFVILFIPLPVVWYLRIPRAQKLAVSGIFLLGGFVCIASVVRVTYVSQSKATDPTWTDVSGCIWSTVEASIGIVSANLPIMRSLFRKLDRAPSSNQGTPELRGSPTNKAFLASPHSSYSGNGNGLIQHIDIIEPQGLPPPQPRPPHYSLREPLTAVTFPERAVVAPWDEEKGLHGRTIL